MDFEQVENYIHWHPVSKDISSILDVLKNFHPLFVNEYIEDIIKNKDIISLSLQDIEKKGNEINDKIFLNEFPNQEDVIPEIISFTESFLKFLFKFDFYDKNTHKPSKGENIIYQLKKFDFIRNIYENINFEILKNSDFIRLLPCVVVLDRIFNFSALITNNFNTAVNRINASNYFYLEENYNSYSFDDEKNLFVKNNKIFLKSFIRYVVLNNANFSNTSQNFTNSVFTNFEDLISKLIYLKDVFTKNGDLNDIMFLLTQNILHFNYSLGELEKLEKSQNKKISKSKTENLFNLFNEYLSSYLNYLIMATFKDGNSVKNIDCKLLIKFTRALILLRKAEFEYSERNFLKDNKLNYDNLKEFIDFYLFKTIFSKQSMLSNYIINEDGALNLIELGSLFEVKDFDSKISLSLLKDYCSDKVVIKNPSSMVDFIKYADGKYKISNINIL